MMKITKSYFLTNRIKEAWEIMESDDSVSPFMYLSYMKFVRRQNLFVARIPVFFLAIDQSDEIIMIAPMSFDFRTLKYNTLGDVGFCDINDFLYKPGLSINDKKMLLSLLREYVGKSLLLSRILIDSDTIKSLDGNYNYIGKVSCVNIPLENEYQDNLKRLSSSVRQNIRTAYNRLIRDSKNFHLEVHYGNMKSSKSLKTQIKDCYEKRHFSAYSNGLSFIRYCIHFIAVKYLRHDNYSLFKNNNTVQAAFYIDGKIAGMFAGILNKKGDRLIIPRLAIDMDYGFYSPGYVMLCESMQYFLAHTNVRNIDLCRGVEKYKYDMGGVKYETIYCEII